ncbi:hypothetical protein DSM104299_00956 [Baekduia alba]|uniref:DUF2848 family protein n=1 Tax=Baekduia alba TaxID=2997333 RepID=UPI0023413CAA|nr:DUF2848 family protein [Baekduia alba]WCB92266.1 hypothetical protein DSM104299_00956 [Baekduia alba]
MRHPTVETMPSGRPARQLDLRDAMLVVAGFTGRDQQALDAHVAELRTLGVPAPSHTPLIFVLPSWLLQIDPGRVHVASEHTSGEVEPVLIREAGGELHVTVGSDHTDRHLEQASYGASKFACPKPIASVAWPLMEVADRWDELRLDAGVDQHLAPYQSASVSTLCDPGELLAEVDCRLDTAGRPLVLFLGTVPVLDESARFASAFSCGLHDRSRSIRLAYAVDVIDPLDASLASLVPPSTADAAGTSTV